MHVLQKVVTHVNVNKQKMTSRRFAGVEKLYGKRVLEQFEQSHIIVIGIGGVGSWVVEALARNAIGKLTIIDMDVVAESNINRQLPALSSTIGRNKIDVMAERANDINPDCELVLVDDFITKENIEELIDPDADYVIDCIDNSRVKASLIAWCKRKKIKIITLGGAGGQTRPGLIKVSDLSKTEHDPLLSKTRKMLRQEYGFTTNKNRRFSIPCVYSTEHLKYSTPIGEITQNKAEADEATGLNCAGGIGSSVMVTASFAFMAVAYVLEKISIKRAL